MFYLTCGCKPSPPINISMENILEIVFYSPTQKTQIRVAVVEEIIEIKTAVHIKYSYHDPCQGP